MAHALDVIVVGGGVMGSSALWQLARRGIDATLFERFSPGHDRSASSGGVRNFNPGYPDETYLDYLARSFDLWCELEDESQEHVIDRTGIVLHGPDLGLPYLRERLPRFGFDAEVIDRITSESLWPGMRFEGDALYVPKAGTIDADLAVTALQRSAQAYGAQIRSHCRVLRVRVLGDDLAQVEVVPENDGGQAGEVEVYETSQLVVTVGAWTRKLVGKVMRMPRLTVTLQQPVYFRDSTGLSWPTFNFHPQLSEARPGFFKPGFYGAVVPGRGTKVGWHRLGDDRDPDAPYPARKDKDLHAFLQRYVREWLPGIGDATIAGERPNLSTGTSDSNFIVDRIGPIVLGAGFSGHGFKFAPAIGASLADLVQGGRAPDLFSIDAGRRASALRRRQEPRVERIR